MTLQKNQTAASAKESVDEIDEIMNEIEELQQSMSTSQAAPVAKAPAPIEEPNVMEEFQAGSGEVSMEETLGDLKDDEPSGPNLIDQAMAEEAAREAAASAEEKQDDLLDAAEAEALDEAVAEEEEAILQEIETEVQEEEVMAEAPRRGRSAPTQNSQSSKAHHGTVSLKLTGDLMLRLSYEFEGQEVLIGFSDGALKVELSDGTEFKIPVRRNQVRRAA